MKTLKIYERRAGIVTALQQNGRMSVTDLARVMGVSEETIRRDAVPLVRDGEVIKDHGSLALPHDGGEASYERRMRDNAAAKLAIARATVKMVSNGDSLVIDSGTTTTFVARELRARQNLTIVTNSTFVAQTLAGHAGNHVYFAGGEMEADNGATHGSAANEFVSRFRVKHAFLSVTALDRDAGPMDAMAYDADFAQVALKAATHRVIVADATKFGAPGFARICGYSDIEVIVTDQSPPPEFFATLSAAGTRLVIASQDAVISPPQTLSQPR